MKSSSYEHSGNYSELHSQSPAKLNKKVRIIVGMARGVDEIAGIKANHKLAVVQPGRMLAMRERLQKRFKNILSDQGTNSDKVNLSIPKTDDEYQSAMNKAVNEGNEEEINRLMSIELPGEPDPDAKAIDTDKSKEGQNGEAPVLADSDKGDDKKPADSASKDAPPDPVATKLAAMEQELNNLRAQAGRVSALQSKISELERERQHASIAKSVVKEKEKPDPADEKITSKIKELAEVDKSTAELLEDMYKEIKQGRHSIDPEELARRLSAEASEREQTQHLQREFEKVVQVHPDFDNIRRHP